MIKILSAELIQYGRKIRIVIEREGRNDFVYPSDKFNNKEELIKEIEASIKKEEQLKTIKNNKINKLKQELGIQDATN